MHDINPSGTEAQISFQLTGVEWWNHIPACAGWYRIMTDAPFSELSTLPIPPKGSKHYNIPACISDAARALSIHMIIEPSKPGELYTVYSGEHQNLKCRAREHFCGHEGTACLALSQYSTVIDGRFRWVFAYTPFCEGMSGSGLAEEDDKVLRVIIEQQWRAARGWPVLCRA